MPAPTAPSPVKDAVQQSILDYRAGIGPGFEQSALAYAHGHALRLAGDPRGALEWWIGALDAPTAEPWPWLMNAVVALALESDELSSTLAALEQRRDRHPALWLWLGHLLRRSGAPEAAVPLLEGAVERLDGALARTAAAELTQALAAAGRLESALALCDARGDPLSAASAVGVLCRLGRHAEALARADALVDRHPGLAEAWLNRGAAQLHLGQRVAAAQSLERCLSLAPALSDTVQALRARHSA